MFAVLTVVLYEVSPDSEEIECFLSGIRAEAKETVAYRIWNITQHNQMGSIATDEIN